MVDLVNMAAVITLITWSLYVFFKYIIKQGRWRRVIIIICQVSILVLFGADLTICILVSSDVSWSTTESSGEAADQSVEEVFSKAPIPVM